MQDFVYRTKFSLEKVGGRRAKLRDIEEGGETLGVILTCRKCRREGSHMNFTCSLLVFGEGCAPVVFARFRTNKES